ncbi:MAG: elongation factor Ts [Sedimentisphaerales bacterium]|nr:elongation factor Ts [Sedimentisphaerales bacterium]
MTAISAAMVNQLRKMSGQGMMDCKQALQETDGDVDKAMEMLRKKGLATLVKRAERETKNGLVVCKTGEDGKSAAMATLCCETDFVAKSDDFINATKALGDYAFACPQNEGIDNCLDTEIDGKKYRDILTELVSKTGEKTQVGDFQKFVVENPGFISTYIHFNEKVGTMVLIESDASIADNQALRNTGNDIAMHVTATKPLALDKDQIDPKMIESERSIFSEQVKDKPANIIDKIVDGKISKFFAENCLVEQPFVKDDSKTVAQVLTDAAKQAGGQAKIVKYVRFELG